MNTEEKKQHALLIEKWNATDITPEQTERLEQLADKEHIAAWGSTFPNDAGDVLFGIRGKQDA